MLPVRREAPRVSASLIDWRSAARLAARRTRRSDHGDLGSHWSKKSRKWMPMAPEKAILMLGSRCSSRAVGVSSMYATSTSRSEEHTSELQSLRHLVCRLLLEKKKYI